MPAFRSAPQEEPDGRYDPDWVRAHYDEYGIREWHRWDDSPVERVKFHVHLHYLQQYVSPGDRVLEIGAGARPFTRELARVADRIVVADLSSGDLSPETIGSGRHYAHLYRAGEFRRTLEEAALKVEIMSASDCLSVNWPDALDEIHEDDPAWAHLIEMEIEACRESGCLHMGAHWIAVEGRRSRAVQKDT